MYLRWLLCSGYLYMYSYLYSNVYSDLNLPRLCCIVYFYFYFYNYCYFYCYCYYYFSVYMRRLRCTVSVSASHVDWNLALSFFSRSRDELFDLPKSGLQSEEVS